MNTRAMPWMHRPAQSLFSIALMGALAGCVGMSGMSNGGSVLGGFSGGAAAASAPWQSYRAEYKTANDHLNSVYQRLSAQMSPAQQQALASGEADWVQARVSACTKDGEMMYGCAARMTDRRIAALEANPNAPAAASAGLAAAAAPPPAQTAQTVTVPVTAMPWLWSAGGMNDDFKFGYPNGTQPVAVELANLGATPGSMVTIDYLGGKIGLGEGGPQADADGFAGLDDDGAPGLMGAFPSAYMQPYPINLGALVGTFTDQDGRIVGQPFAVGAAKMSRPVPPGASQLQLGINDDVFGGETAATRNSGGFTVAVSVSQGG